MTRDDPDFVERLEYGFSLLDPDYPEMFDDEEEEAEEFDLDIPGLEGLVPENDD